MAMAANMSARLGWIDHELFERTQQLLSCADLPVAPPEVLPFKPKSLSCADWVFNSSIMMVFCRV